MLLAVSLNWQTLPPSDLHIALATMRRSCETPVAFALSALLRCLLMTSLPKEAADAARHCAPPQRLGAAL